MSAESIIFCLVMAGVIISEIMMWQHVRNIRKNIDKIFDRKSEEEIYKFINKTVDIDKPETD